MLTATVGMFLSIVLLSTYLSPRLKRRVVGYGLLVDVASFVLCLTVFGGTGTERLAAIGSAVGITLSIHAYKWAFGYEKFNFTTMRWQRYAGRFT